MIVWNDLSEEDQKMLGEVLAENDNPPTVGEVKDAIADLREEKYKQLRRMSTRAIAEAERKGKTGQIPLLLVLRKAIEADYLMAKYQGDFSRKGIEEWKRGYNMLQECMRITRAAKKA